MALDQQAYNLVSHPAVLLAAWQRVRRWYGSGEAPPQPEYAEWLCDSDAKLKELGKKVRQGEYRGPAQFPLIPYPKKGATLRHYCRPSIEDQVIFAAYGLLVAPWLEACMPEFSFGNRWYRGVYQERNDNSTKLVWKNRGFTLEDHEFYQPYRRAHGLFRRVAHWSVQSMLGSKHSQSSSLEKILQPESYPKDALPAFVQPNWWSGVTAPQRGFWVELDLQAAYPSVRIKVLQERMKNALINENSKLNADYPIEILTQLNDSELRRTLGEQLCNLLSQIRYDESIISGDLWRPPHVNHALVSGNGEGHPGLPTGLAISGLLMNTYLLPLDIDMKTWMEQRRMTAEPAAFLRFADDMIILAPSETALLEGIDKLWEGLCSNEMDPMLALPDKDGGCNLRVNWSKVGPEPISKLLSGYLESHRWEKCGGCDQFFPPEKTSHDGVKSVSKWWIERSEKEKKDFRLELGRQALTKDNMVNRPGNRGGWLV